MKTIIVMTLVVSSAVTGIYQHTQYQSSLTAARKALHERVAHAGRLYGAKQEAAYWKGMAERMTREVECIPLVGGKENRRFNRHEDPSTVVNDPGRFWYS
jgi:hypothetical protein